MATATVSLGTSNLRGSSRPTRANSSRALRTARSSLHQNSLVTNPAASTHALSEPHGFYPAITAFTDAITALPRDYRRHTSLLKEVDAKAWFLEESLQTLLTQGLIERQTRPSASAANTIEGSIANNPDSAVLLSGATSVNGMALDNLSQFSSQSADPEVLQRRQLHMALRHNLMQMMVTMDEKNHVINNASEDLSRHIRRLDSVWPHISEEISEEVRLGSLKHWAYTETNPIAKKITAVSRREAGSALAMLADNDIAHRSESRRVAMLAKKQRLNQHLDSDIDDKAVRKGANAGKTRKPEPIAESAVQAATSLGKRKTGKGAGGVAMERTGSGRTGGTAMSREPSHQENSKKRKAPTAASTNARKRLNPGVYESPKLASSPLANATGKESVKRSPALTTVRPVARARQNSTQSEAARNKPSSSVARNATAISASEVPSMMAATGRSASDVKSSLKESTNNKGQRLVEEDRPSNGESLRGGLLLERTASKQSNLKKEVHHEGKAVSSPRLGVLTTAQEPKTGRGRASKVSTPVLGTFEEAEGETSANGSRSETGGPESMTANKPKRAPRPRMKDHHGLQDSLSPKGLPSKRTHNKTSSFSSLNAQPLIGKPPSSRARDRDRDTDRDTDGNVGPTISSTSATVISRSNSRNNTNTNIAAPSTSSNSQPSGAGQSDTRSTGDENDGNDDDNDNDIGDTEGDTTKAEGDADADADGDGDAEVDGDGDGDGEVEGEGEGDLDEDERYCLCNGPSYGEMVACDNKNCPREWFHLGCIGLKKLPSAAKWYCDECKEELTRRGRF